MLNALPQPTSCHPHHQPAGPPLAPGAKPFIETCFWVGVLYVAEQLPRCDLLKVSPRHKGLSPILSLPLGPPTHHSGSKGRRRGGGGEPDSGRAPRTTLVSGVHSFCAQPSNSPLLSQPHWGLLAQAGRGNWEWVVADAAPFPGRPRAGSLLGSSSQPPVVIPPTPTPMHKFVHQASSLKITEGEKELTLLNTRHVTRDGLCTLYMLSLVIQ
uniref:Uncharacterized protein n=1 Tax=Myotis myotis TaxID=51298 RepID=A0A7J7UPW6_MYOMY|nr:hypothetical protein mMyoMyo1_008611 [Myotis myotis]